MLRTGLGAIPALGKFSNSDECFQCLLLCVPHTANGELSALPFKECQEVLSSVSILAQRLNIRPHNLGQRGTGDTQCSPGGPSQDEDALGGHHKYDPFTK